jgi:hypothetical protein
MLFLRTISVLAIFCAMAAEAQVQLREGLVSYWPFNAIGGDTTPDVISGNNLYLYNMGETNLVAGRYGQALAFDGTSQLLAFNYARNPKLPIQAAKSHTVTLWVKGPPRQKNCILFAEGSTLERLPLFLLGTHKEGQSAAANVFIRPSSKEPLIDNVSAEATAFDDNWHHLAWVDDNGVAKLYVDGRLDVTMFAYERKKFSLNYIAIGGLPRDPPVYFFQGAMDDVAIWERGLSKAEIVRVMNGELVAMLSSSENKTAAN